MSHRKDSNGYGVWGSSSDGGGNHNTSTNPFASNNHGAAATGNVDGITRKVLEFNNTVNTFRRKINDFGTFRDTRRFRQTLVDQRTQGMSEARSIKKAIDNYQPDATSKAKVSRLTSQFTDLLKEFEELAKHSMRREREITPQEQRVTTTQDYDNDNSDETAQVESLLQVAPADAELATERNEEMKKLERDMTDLHECFVDMSMLVSEQGKAVDNIEANAMEADTDVGDAVVELKKAKVFQSKARRKIICVVILILILVAVIVIPIAVKHSGKSK